MLDKDKLKNEQILLYCRRDLYTSDKLLELLFTLSSNQLKQDVFPEILKL